MKIYIAYRDDGMWEDAIQTVLGVFDSEEKAQAACDRVVNKIKAIESQQCPYKDIPYESLTHDQSQKQYEWQLQKYEVDEFNGCCVREYKLNEERFI